ncbi:MAG: hypothetical protein NTV69_10115 [Caldilinea sp.]|nr:hypothetical protein [Caldilinea sp.]
MSILCADPVWSAYALADQQPQLAPYCRWLLSAQEDEPGVVLFFDGLAPPVLFAAGSSAGVAAALKGQRLPDAVYLSVLPEHLPGLAWHWEWGELRPMWRMVLVGPQPVVSLPAGYHFRPLKQVDLSAVEALFAHGGPFTPDAFAAHQLELGPFYAAVDADGRLAAIGGTHDPTVAARGWRQRFWGCWLRSCGRAASRRSCSMWISATVQRSESIAAAASPSTVAILKGRRPCAHRRVTLLV